MELRDFVAQALRDVVQGIRDAQQTEGVGGYIAPDGFGPHKVPEMRGVIFDRECKTVVEFDIAVTAEEAQTHGGKGGAKIGIRALGAGGELSHEDLSKSAATHRIRFAVPLMMPKNPRSWGKEHDATPQA